MVEPADDEEENLWDPSQRKSNLPVMRHASLLDGDSIAEMYSGKRTAERSHSVPVAALLDLLEGDTQGGSNNNNESQQSPIDPPPSYTYFPPNTAYIPTVHYNHHPPPWATRFDTMSSYTDHPAAIQPQPPQQQIPMPPQAIVQGRMDEPFLVQCPFCRATVTTITTPTAGCLTYLACLACGVLGLVCGCCLVPFCLRRLRDIRHSCPKCSQTIALYKRL